MKGRTLSVYVGSLQFVQLAKALGGIVYIMHILGCGWFWIAASRQAEEVTWLHEYNDGKALTAGVWTQCGARGLILPPPGCAVAKMLLPLSQRSPIESHRPLRYLYSIYWALMILTTVGYGDVIPANDTERLYTLVCLMLGAFVFGFLLSTVADLLKNADQNAVRIDQKLDEVKVYLRWYQFRPELAARVRRYYEFYFARKSAMDEDEILRHLAPTLRRTVHTHLLGRTVMKIPIFSSERAYVHLDLQLQVHQMIMPILRDSRELIMESLEKGAHGGPSIFFVRRGTIAARGDLPAVSFYEINASTEPGTILGEHSLMTDGVCDCTYRATTRCELFALSVEDFHTVLAPLDREHKDEVAGIVYAEYARRKLLRSLAMRFVLNTLASHRDADPTLRAGLRFQTRWFSKKAREAMRHRHDKDTLSHLLPAIYFKHFRTMNPSIVGGLMRSRLRKPRPSDAQAVVEQARASVGDIDSNASELATAIKPPTPTAVHTGSDVDDHGKAQSAFGVPVDAASVPPPMPGSAIVELQAQVAKIEAQIVALSSPRGLAETIQLAVEAAMAKQSSPSPGERPC